MTENSNLEPNFASPMMTLARFYLGPVLTDLAANAASLADAVDPDSEAMPMAEALFRSLQELCLSKEHQAAVAKLMSNYPELDTWL